MLPVCVLPLFYFYCFVRRSKNILFPLQNTSSPAANVTAHSLKLIRASGAADLPPFRRIFALSTSPKAAGNEALLRLRKPPLRLGTTSTSVFVFLFLVAGSPQMIYSLGATAGVIFALRASSLVRHMGLGVSGRSTCVWAAWPVYPLCQTSRLTKTY